MLGHQRIQMLSQFWNQSVQTAEKEEMVFRAKAEENLELPECTAAATL